MKEMFERMLMRYLHKRGWIGFRRADPSWPKNTYQTSFAQWKKIYIDVMGIEQGK